MARNRQGKSTIIKTTVYLIQTPKKASDSLCRKRFFARERPHCPLWAPKRALCERHPPSPKAAADKLSYTEKSKCHACSLIGLKATLLTEIKMRISRASQGASMKHPKKLPLTQIQAVQICQRSFGHLAVKGADCVAQIADCEGIRLFLDGQFTGRPCGFERLGQRIDIDALLH
jgi:hypothetical protein